MRRLILAGTLAALALPAFAEREVSHAVSASIPRGNVKRVVIDIPAGEFRVKNGDAIRIDGEVRRNYDGPRSRERNQRIVDDLSAEIIVDGDEAVIQRKIGKNARGFMVRNNSAYEVTIEVPAGIDLEFDTRFGEVKLDGTFGNVDVDMNAGEIRMSTPRASVHDLKASVRVGEVHADLGDRRITSEGVFPHAAHFSNPDSGKTEVRLHVTAGEVHVTLTR